MDKYIVLGTILLAVIVCIIISFKSRTNIKEYPDDCRNDCLFRKVVKKCNVWFAASVIWTVFEYLGIIIPFEAACFALHISTSNESGDYSNSIINYSIVSMVAIVVVFAINPKKHAVGYRKAYVCAENELNSMEVNHENLQSALEQGEYYINSAFGIDNDKCTNEKCRYCGKKNEDDQE